MDTTGRIIGAYTGAQHGPLVIVLGGMHGNEPAGVRAIDMVFHKIAVEPLHNANFTFRGQLLGLRGNVQAQSQGIRYLVKDLNRQFNPEHIAWVRACQPDALQAEDRELYELLDTIDTAVATYLPTQLIVLDLHTTTADGGIFSIATDDPRSIALAQALHAPVITGMLHGLRGTTLHHFTDAHYPCPTVGVTFEAGQHDDPLSTRRCMAAIINLLRSVGCVRAEDVENQHDELLINYSRGLPTLAKLKKVHPVRTGDGFRMQPGYRNFQSVQAGEILAYDHRGPIQAPEDGHILMPLYQPQGEDGFFLIEALQM